MAIGDDDTFHKLVRRHAEPVERLSGPVRDVERLSKVFEAASKNHAFETLWRTSAAEQAFAQMTESTRLPALDNNIQRILDTIGEQSRVAHEALGPLHDLERIGAQARVAMEIPAFSLIDEAIERVQKTFRLLEVGEASRIAAELTRVNERFATIPLPAPVIPSAVEAAMEQMRSPWLHMENTLQSAKSFASLQSIGEMLDRLNGFDNENAAHLRGFLGDWRERIAWPADLENIGVRTALYAARGLDLSLTDFPSPAFEESIAIARLDRPVPRVIELDDYDIEGESDEERGSFARTNAAQARLLRFEYYLRRFIDREMRVAFGDDWIERQVDDETRRQWKDKQKAAQEKGERPHKLIDYADFTDYERVITRRDNWKKVFQPVFRKRESVQESLQRLYPVRLCSFHARLLTQDDELLLYVEVKRVLKAIGAIGP